MIVLLQLAPRSYETARYRTCYKLARRDAPRRLPDGTHPSDSMGIQSRLGPPLLSGPPRGGVGAENRSGCRRGMGGSILRQRRRMSVRHLAEVKMTIEIRSPNKVTRADAGGLRQLPVWTPWTASIAQFRRTGRCWSQSGGRGRHP